MYRILCFCALGGVLVWSSACRRTSDPEKIAEVDGTVVTRMDLDRSAAKALHNARQQLYKLERQKLEEYIGATLLTREAKNRGISASTLLEQEVNRKIAPITEAEIEDFYNRNKDRLRVEFEKVHDQIRDYLREQRIESGKSEFLVTLRSKAKITSYLKSPRIFRADVAVNGAPFTGTQKAAVTIVKFEDFQCSYCKSVQPTSWCSALLRGRWCDRRMVPILG